MSDMIIRSAAPFPHGCYKDSEGIHVSAAFPEGKTCGIVLKNTKTGEERRVALPSYCRNGSIYSAFLQCDTNAYDGYLLYADDAVFVDPYAQCISGLELWGADPDESQMICLFDRLQTDWSEDVNPRTPMQDSVVYLLHVRGFTMHKSSGVDKHKRGTFLGILDKLDYLKDLGVTVIELMPAYEMNVVRPDGNTEQALKASFVFVRDGEVESQAETKKKVNFWGFKEGYYFAPRAAYCADPSDPQNEFADFVKTLHANGLEVILQLYFPNRLTPAFILDVVRFWVYTYHIDGVHLKGERIPAAMIAADPLLQEIKLWHDTFDEEALDAAGARQPLRLSEYRNDFRITASRFVKGDDATVAYFTAQMNHLGASCGAVNYVGNYDGFTLMDLVSYEHKRNEANGENNADGENNNFSWNCGVEGPSRKKNIQKLRKKQMENLLSMLFFSLGTPLLHSGDEFANTQDGNNNPYCQDNATGWVDWSGLEKHADLHAFVRQLIRFRKEKTYLHRTTPFQMTDLQSIGFPDLSFHGIEAWRPDLSNYSHAVGVLYCGLYAGCEEFLYVAYNMHWSDVKLALPPLPDGMRWTLVMDTERELFAPEGISCDQRSVRTASRSTQVLVSTGKRKVTKKQPGRQPF